MIKLLPYLCIVGMIAFSFEAAGQKLIPNSKCSGICYAGNKVHRIYIPPRIKPVFRKSSAAGGTIAVQYTGLTTEAKNAVGFAASILEEMLPPGFKVNVHVSWTTIASAGVLGNSSITGFVAGWTVDALNPAVYYPVTIAEKIAGKSLNDDYQADIRLELNSSIKWYYGTDGKTPTNRYDLVTVVLHELCHGLGFFDSMNVDGNEGYYGLSGAPVIYDTFVENISGKKLTDTTLFSNNSAALRTELTGGQLYFNGPLAFRYLLNNRARLFAPSTWDPGSSVSHLDETRTSEVNSLMTPYIDFGEAIHDPGGLTMSILGDLGWINTRIVPQEMKDTEEHLASVPLSASIKSDTSYNRNNVSLVYSYDNFTTSASLRLSETPASGHFTGTVTIPSYNTKVSYYFSAEDFFGRVYNSPSLAGKAPYTIFVGTDTARPSIIHRPVDYYFEKIDSMSFDATVTDNLGVDTVYLEYNVNGGVSREFGMTGSGNDKFRKVIDVRPLGLSGGDAFNYRIVAADRAAGHNTAILPSSGWFTVEIEALRQVVDSYSTDFSDAGDDFFSSGLSITQPAGFGSPALHSGHPYPSPEVDGKYLNFSSVLRHPVVFDTAGMVISYRELALVEPGEPEAPFGSSDFYDYVIVEGSKNFGRTWFPMADGYDCRFNSAWESAYNSSTDGQNSTFIGTESMMLTHNIYPKISGRISNGDSLLIRFRLYSDPYAHGWGWVVDDLKVRRLIDDVKETRLAGISIYPNPGNGIITVSVDNVIISGGLSLKVFNVTGQCILGDGRFYDGRAVLDISGYPTGLYFIVIGDPGGSRSFRYFLIR
jgi:hypothetical protein